MADGRNFTDYRDSFVVNNLVISDNKNSVSNDSYDYRMFLQQNASQIGKKLGASLFKNGVFNCEQPYETGTMLPEQVMQSCDAHRCDFTENYADGVGVKEEEAHAIIQIIYVYLH